VSRTRPAAAKERGDDVAAAVLIALASVAIAVIGTRAAIFGNSARDDWQRAAKERVDQEHFYALDAILGYDAGRAALDRADARISRTLLGRPSAGLRGAAASLELRPARPYLAKLGYFPVDPYVRDLDRLHSGPVGFLQFTHGDHTAKLALVDGAGALAAAIALALAAASSVRHRRRILHVEAALALAAAAAIGIACEVAG